MVKNLKTLREDRQLSQQKLGEQIGVTQQAILLSRFFETSVDYLIGNSDNPRKYEQLNPCDLNLSEQSHIDTYRKTPPSVRLIIDAFMHAYLNK